MDDLKQVPNKRRSSRHRAFGGLALCAATAIVCTYLALPRLLGDSTAYEYQVYQHGLEQCMLNHAAIDFAAANSRRENPRWEPDTAPVLIKNANLLDGDGTALGYRNLYLDKGIVQKIVSADTQIDAPDNAIVQDARGRYVTPGLVDMHSHAGDDSLPDLWAAADDNEKSDPITNQVRSIDAINLDDLSIPRIASGGVTTNLILPGSANLMGGEAYAIKMRLPDTLSVEDALVQAHTQGKRQRWMKFACGENPKRVYPDKINSRLGESWAYRRRFEQAQKLMQQQDHWCAQASKGIQHVHLQPYPSELELENLVSVLRGDVKVNTHCYETQDLEMFLRNTAEFDVQVTAFHHALDAWRVPELLKRGNPNITIATFASVWGYKKEAFQASPWAGKILTDNGIAVAYKSDHAVTDSRNLVYQAGVAHHFDMPAHLALASVTSVPARALGLDHRIGYARVGYDADIVLWDQHPLSLGATPVNVWIDGKGLFDVKIKAAEKEASSTDLHTNKITNGVSHTLESAHCALGSRDLILTGLVSDSPQNSQPHDQGVAIVRDGRIVCAGDCTSELSTAQADGVATVHVENGHLVPAVSAMVPAMGLAEITSETSTMDGIVNTKMDPDNDHNVVYAKDGLSLGGRHLHRASKMGVITGIVAPLSESMLSGVSVAYKINATSILDPEAIVKDDVALHITIGQDGKGEGADKLSVSQQIELLRRTLVANDGKNNVYGRVTKGHLPLVINSDNRDTIGRIIKLKAELSRMPLYIVIVGGVEAHMIADELAAAEIPVLLNRGRCMPTHWESRHCLPGPPMSEDTNLGVLHRAGVKVGIVTDDDAVAGELLWDAVWAAKAARSFTKGEALALISTNIREIMRLPDNQDSEFIVYQGDPAGFGARIALTFDQQVRSCYPLP